MNQRLIHGSCHCGNIRFELGWPKLEKEISVRECGCTFCTKHAGAWTSHPDSELVVQIGDSSAVSEYRFGTETAKFCVCAVCGVVPLVLCDIENSLYAVVNVHTFEDIDGLTFSRLTTSFDGESTSSRLQRRERNWIPGVQVRFDEGDG